MNKQKQSNKQQTVSKELQPLCINKEKNTRKGKNTIWQSRERKREFLERKALKSISGKITEWSHKTTQFVYL